MTATRGAWFVRSIAALFVTVLLLASEPISAQPCPGNCNGNGRCNHGRVCHCYDGFTGADCSLKLCAKGIAWADEATDVDTAHNIAECSNMGICDRLTGLCTCRLGFEGTACERMTCPGRCNGHGECQSMYSYAAAKDPGSGTVFPYSSNWDAKLIYGCNCDEGFDGPDCTLRVCPKGDDPLTTTVTVSGVSTTQNNEIQLVSCTATGGMFTMSYKGETSAWIRFNAKASELSTKIGAMSTIGGSSNIKITFSQGAQACSETGNVFSVEFLQAFGDIPSLVPNSVKLTSSSSTVKVALTVTESTKGSKENAPCSNRGICDYTVGVCQCATNYDTSNGYNAFGTRGDCGYATAVIQFCPGQVSCSGHGNCQGSPTFACSCFDGWTGADCSMRVCPSDVPWFHLPESSQVAHLTKREECSGKGICDRALGTCTCVQGFTGASCNRLLCPGDAIPCNNHGRCADMQTLATLAKVNGVTAGFTYGETPNDPVTWDANKVFGCHCDQGFEGYDCSLRSCPHGDNPDTVQQIDESVIFSCTDDDGDGSITATFRDESFSLTATSSTSDVKAALEALDGIREVKVELLNSDNDDQLCTSTGNIFVVTFLTEHGDLPDFTYTSTDISGDSFKITEYHKGTKETDECSGRGLCDHVTGLCQCFTGYGPSDGKGGPGDIGDCGYVLPAVAHGD